MHVVFSFEQKRKRGNDDESINTFSNIHYLIVLFVIVSAAERRRERKNEYPER